MNILRGMACIVLMAALSACSMTAPANEEPAHEHAEGVIHLHDEDFAGMIVEIMYHLDQYEGMTLQMEGLAVLPEGEEFEGLPVSFGVVRSFVMNGEEGYIGLDCYHEGDIPKEEEPVSITGVITHYEDHLGDVYPLIMVQAWESVPEESISVLQLTEADLEHSHQ